MEALRNGYDRPIGGEDNGYTCRPGAVIEYRFAAPVAVHGARIVWDSELNRESMPRIGGRPFVHNMMCNKPFNMADFHVPDAMTKAYRIEGVREDGAAETLCSTDENHQRLNQVPLSGVWAAVRLIPLAAWGAQSIHLFSFDVY